jgi:tRNA(Ile)-lysidine synthase
MSDIYQHITQKWDFLSTKKIFLACSGGVDSMTLLSIFIKTKWDVEVLHVNYNLRGQDSIDDQKLVEESCIKNNIPFHLNNIELQPILDNKGGNLQEIARKIRYDFFYEKKNLSTDNYIALGHHLDDQVETFFMHIARKSGVMGMACMKENNDRFIRPLLPFSKKEIIQYAEENQINWREDYSNKTNKYSRNILRNILIPEITNSFPDLTESILLLVQKFQETQLELESKISPLVQTIHSNASLSFEVYDMLSTFEKNELFRQLEQKAGLQLEVEKLRSTQKGKKVELLTNSHQFTSIIREENNFVFISESSKNNSIHNIVIEEIDHLPSTFSKEIIYLDSIKIKGKLTIRKWKLGDRMRPIGMNGSKLLSDIIKDAKTPSHLKKDILIVEDEEKILWCVGIKISSEAIATDNSEQIIKVSLN